MGRTELQKLLEQKKMTKKQILGHFWPQEKNTKNDSALLVILAPKNDSAQKQILTEMLNGLMVLPMHSLVISDEASPIDVKDTKIAWCSATKSQLEKYLLAADLGLTFEEHQTLIQDFFNKGVVAVGHEKSPLLANYRPNEETGNSFTFDSLNPWAIFLALVRACETFKFPYDWQHIIRGILKVR